MKTTDTPTHLAPIGATVRLTEAYIQARRQQWGSGWSERDRANHKRWEADLRAERWTVAEHLPPLTEHNRGMGWGYLLRGEGMLAGRTSMTVDYKWEVAP